MHTSCAVSTLETRTHAAPTLGVRIHLIIHFFQFHPEIYVLTPTLGENIQKYQLLE